MALWAPRDGTWVPVRLCQVKPGGFLACSPTPGAGKQTCGTSWSSLKGALGAEHSKVPELVGIRQSGLGTRNFPGLSLGDFRRIYLLLHKLLFTNVIVHKCYYSQMLLLTTCSD